MCTYRSEHVHTQMIQNACCMHTKTYTCRFGLQASGFRDGLISHACEREGTGLWQHHKVVAKVHFMARSGPGSVHTVIHIFVCHMPYGSSGLLWPADH
jgi:hypothetical protein